jgi:hypothetical protein
VPAARHRQEFGNPLQCAQSSCRQRVDPLRQVARP